MNAFLRFTGVLAVFIAVIAWQYEATPINPQPAEYHLVKLDALGNALPPWSGPWHCVKDTNTGLIWEVKNNNENLHHGSWTYSWFDGQLGSEKGGNCNHEQGYQCDAIDIIQKANAQGLCGITQWRLPTAQELITLVKPENIGYTAAIDTAYFPFTRKSVYWTSDKEQPLTGFYERFGKGAKGIEFKEGKEVTLPYSNAAFIRLVHKPQ